MKVTWVYEHGVFASGDAPWIRVGLDNAVAGRFVRLPAVALAR